MNKAFHYKAIHISFNNVDIKEEGTKVVKGLFEQNGESHSLGECLITVKY